MSSLPLFPNMLDPKIYKSFMQLCRDDEDGLVDKLIIDVDNHVAQVRSALRMNEFLDIQTVERMADVLQYLLTNIDGYPTEKQKMVIGAAYYFIKSDDVHSDFESILGFDDDLAVLNYVLAELGHADMRITL